MTVTLKHILADIVVTLDISSEIIFMPLNISRMNIFRKTYWPGMTH